MYIFYLCDQRACEKCHYPTCRHTNDVSHAVNFAMFGDGSIWEKDYGVLDFIAQAHLEGAVSDE